LCPFMFHDDAKDHEVIMIILITPARIAQFLYDQATKLSHTKFGWLALALAFGTMNLTYSTFSC
jgi:hypothetical protein